MRTTPSERGPAPHQPRSRRRLDVANEPLPRALLAAPYVVAGVLAAITAHVLRRATRP